MQPIRFRFRSYAFVTAIRVHILFLKHSLFLVAKRSKTNLINKIKLVNLIDLRNKTVMYLSVAIDTCKIFEGMWFTYCDPPYCWLCSQMGAVVTMK